MGRENWFLAAGEEGSLGRHRDAATAASSVSLTRIVWAALCSAPQQTRENHCPPPGSALQKAGRGWTDLPAARGIFKKHVMGTSHRAPPYRATHTEPSPQAAPGWLARVISHTCCRAGPTSALFIFWVFVVCFLGDALPSPGQSFSTCQCCAGLTFPSFFMP